MTDPVAAIAAIAGPNASDALALSRTTAPPPQERVSFSQLFLDGVDNVSRKANDADALVKAFVLDDSIPPHQVMYALEQSQLALQMMLQVRNRLVEDYQDIMRMQL